MSLREKLAGKKARTVEIPVPEIGETVYARALSLSERDTLFAALNPKDGKLSQGAQIASLLCMSIVDADGNPAFTMEDVSLLLTLEAGIADRIWTASAKLNGLRDDDVKEAEKNSAGGQSAG